jgi:hypothetical protein
MIFTVSYPVKKSRRSGSNLKKSKTGFEVSVYIIKLLVDGTVVREL